MTLAADTHSTPIHILVAEDSPVQAKRLGYLLEEHGYRVTTASDGRAALAAAQQDPPGVVISDIRMPLMDGYELCAALKADPALTSVPVVLLTALSDPHDIIHGLQSGADNFITKPYADEALLARLKYLLANRALQQQHGTAARALDIVFQGETYAISADRQQILNLLLSVFEAAVQKNDELTRAQDELRGLNRQVQNQNALLEDQVRQRTVQLEEARIETLYRMARTAEYRDDDTGEHTRRVGLLAGRIGRQVGLDDATVEQLEQAAPLHDVGKVGISDGVLLKPGRLTPEEFAIMKTHTAIGASILEGSTSAVLRLAEQIARSHHEHWAGGGYPAGLVGEQIPLAARIVAVADVFDALTHERPYKAAWPVAEAVAELRRLSGNHLDPRAVEGFLACPDATGPA